MQEFKCVKEQQLLNSMPGASLKAYQGFRDVHRLLHCSVKSGCPENDNSHSPFFFTLLLENAQSHLISMRHFHTHLRSPKCGFHNVAPALELVHTDRCSPFVMFNLIIKRNSPKHEHTTLLLIPSC